MNRKEKYTEEAGLEHRKDFAQFFTPPKIAKFMVDWVLGGKGENAVHDPAFGLGAFFEAAPESCKFTGTEIDKTIFDFFKANAERQPSELKLADYLLDFGRTIPNIVCNPPYLRFQRFSNRDEVIERFEKELGVKISGYTNIASAFLMKSISELSPDGRLSYIMPSEFLNTGYGSIIKDWLIRDRHLDSIIEIECEKEAFDDVITSVCIVFYDAYRKIDSVSFRKVTSLAELDDVMNRSPISAVPVSDLDIKKKWGIFFTSEDERVHLDEGKLQSLSEYGRFSRGIATGNNGFFVKTKNEVKELGLGKDVIPCITQSKQMSSLVFNEEDWQKLSADGAPVYLFSPRFPLDKNASKYIEDGEHTGQNNGYITRHRSPWYKTEDRDVPPIILNVFSRDGYKVIRNYSSARTLTCFHCFYPESDKYVDWIFLYLHSEVGRKIVSLSKRKYGNSLDKYEPNDLNNSLVPKPSFFDSIGDKTLHKLMKKIKEGKDVGPELQNLFSPLVVLDD